MLVPWTGMDIERTFETFDRMLQEFDRVFNWADPTASTVEEWWPRLDVREEDDAWVVTAMVPGLGPEDIEVTVSADELTIRAERRVDVPEGLKPLRRERPHLRFTRTLRLGRDIDPEHVEAKVRRGVLTVRLPKRAEHRPRAIEVQAG